MRRRHRLAVTAALLGGAVGAVLLFTALGSATEGPLGHLLTRVGTWVGTVEHRLRERASGPGRSAAMSWFAPYRENAERLRRPDRILLGAYDSLTPATLEGTAEVERALGLPLPILHVYTAWGDKPDQQFPVRLVNGIWNMGSVPMITWEPWLTDFENVLHPSLPLRTERERGGLAAIGRGEYDFYVDSWAAAAAEFGHPLFVRFAHEMNDPYRYPWGPHNNTRDDFLAAWWHVHTRFHAAGAANVIWVWSPHVAYESWERYYPGEDYADWVGTGALNFGTVARWSQWWSFHELFGTQYPRIETFGKPVMVDEFGSLQVGGDRSAWFREALADLPTRYPAVRGLLFFHARGDTTLTYQAVDWSFAGDAEVSQAIGDTIRTWPSPPR